MKETSMRDQNLFVIVILYRHNHLINLHIILIMGGRKKNVRMCHRNE